MAKNYYYFKSIEEGKELRIIPLENQTTSTGEPVNTSFKVTCSKDVRNTHKVGTIFVGDSLELSSSGKFYKTKNFRKLEFIEKEAVECYEKLTGKKIEKETLYDSISKDEKLKAPTSSGDGFYMSKNDWDILVRNIKKHINTLIVGPTGTGKTSVVKEVCERMGTKLHIFDMGSMIDPISSLLGVHRLNKGGSIFDYAKFTKVIQEPCVILLDELNRGSLACENVLFPCLDDRRKLSIEIAGGEDKREILVHPDVTFIATANVGAEYSGTNSMDRALVNRFFPLELGCIPGDEEAKVLTKRTGISIDSSKIIVKVANNIRSLFKKQEVSVSLSIRETLMVADLISDGWDIGKAMEMVYLPLYEGTKNEGERSSIYKTISSY